MDRNLIIDTYKEELVKEKDLLKSFILLGVIHELENDGSLLSETIDTQNEITMNSAIDYLNDYYERYRYSGEDIVKILIEHGVLGEDDVSQYKSARYNNCLSALIDDGIIDESDIKEYCKENFDAYDMCYISWE